MYDMTEKLTIELRYHTIEKLMRFCQAKDICVNEALAKMISDICDKETLAQKVAAHDNGENQTPPTASAPEPSSAPVTAPAPVSDSTSASATSPQKKDNTPAPTQPALLPEEEEDPFADFDFS